MMKLKNINFLIRLIRKCKVRKQKPPAYSQDKAGVIVVVGERAGGLAWTLSSL